MTAQASAVPPSQSAVQKSNEGTTVIDNIVVAKIAAAAAQEIGGIHGMGSGGVGGTISGALGAVTGALPGSGAGQSTQGVSVEVGNEEAIVNLNIVVDYGARIPQIVEALRRNITDRLQTLTGLTTRAVNVEVSDVYFPDIQPSQPSQPSTNQR